MITDDAELRVSLEQLSRVYTALAALRAEHPKASPEWFAVLAEGFIDHAQQLRYEIEKYTGVSDHTLDCSPTEPVEDYIGDLREIDLDNLTMVVRNSNDVREVRCTLDESLLESAKKALDQRVKVSGVRQRRPGQRPLPTLHVVDLEVLGKATTENLPRSEP
ncbi:MAG TPA: hypothetical protein VN688_26450 [Gemmataceae bacterium]|nr:hypothetical protein [Gemmataceae bacterium]